MLSLILGGHRPPPQTERILHFCWQGEGIGSILFFPIMRSISLVKVKDRSESRHAERSPQPQTGEFSSIVTTGLLAIILATGPLVLGAARLWIELPLLGVVTLLFLIQALRLKAALSNGMPLKADAIDLSVVLFVFYAVARWLTSPTEYFSRLEAMNVLAYAVVFFTCRYGLVRRTHGLILLGLLVVLGLFETAFGYYLVSHHDFFPFGPSEQLQLYYAPRWVGTYGCPNHYVSLLVMAIGAALALGCFSKLSWPMRIVLFYLAAMMMVGVMYSQSRGGWLALIASVCGLTIFGIRQGTLRWWIPLSAAALLVVSFGAVLASSPFVQTRFAEVTETIREGRLNTYVRVELALDALRIAQDHPIFGTGPATFAYVHPRYQTSTFAKKAVLTHDDYLNCLDDYGLVGFGLVMIFVMAVTLKFFHRLRPDNRWPDRVLVAGGFAAWLALLTHSAFDFNMHIPANAFMLFALVGMGLRGIDGEVRSWGTLSLAPFGQWLGWALAVLSLAYGVQVARSAVSDIIYEKALALALESSSDQSIQRGQEALKFDRNNVPALVFVGDWYRYQASRKRIIEDRVSIGQKALESYQKALKANPLDDAIQSRLGMTFDVMRRYSEAFFCYKAAVTAQPYNGQFWNVLGNHYWQRAMLEKAEQAYLLAAQCPHGFEGSKDAAKELRWILNQKGVPPPAPGTNPLKVVPAAAVEESTAP